MLSRVACFSPAEDQRVHTVSTLGGRNKELIDIEKSINTF